MRVVVFETEDWEREACHRLGTSHALACTREPLDARTAGTHTDAEVLERLPRLRLIANRSTGYDHIDLDFCRIRETTVCSVPGYSDATTVAEHVLALLDISHRLVEAVEATRCGVFAHEGLRDFDLRDRCLGVARTGRTGRRVIAIAKGSGTEVMAHDLRPDEAAAAPPGFRYAPCGAVLAKSDVLTLHQPESSAPRRPSPPRSSAR